MSASSRDSKILVLLDAHAIIHRAYHALPQFTSSKGEPTGALYGLSAMLMKIIDELKPDYVIACYDLPGKTFRHEVYDAYKAGRVKADDALITQLKGSRQVFEAFDIPIYDSPGFEADDILGTIVSKLTKEKDLNIIIASGDMDTMQLINGNKVQVYTLKKGINDTILYDEDKVIERFGFGPKLLPDYKGLRGDTADNIIGIKGIGEKTATTLISKIGTVEEIYKKLKKDSKIFGEYGLTQKILERIKNGEEDAHFSKTLATIRRDAPVKFSLPETKFWERLDPTKVEKMFSRLEFRSLLSRLKNFLNKHGKELRNKAVSLPYENKEKIDNDKLREASIALWLINSDLVNPNLEDILNFSGIQSFQEAYKNVFTELKKKNLEKVFFEIEKPIISIVSGMEDRGVLINKDYFKKLSQDYHTGLEKLIKKIYKEAGSEFNINSPKQLSEILFGKLGIKNSKKRNTSGAFSTKASILEELEEDYPIIKNIMSYRELQKLLSTYIDVIPNMAGKDGRLHAHFIQNGSTTGRFSSAEPNLQNLPIKTDLGKRIRHGFIATPGHKLSAFDYSQIELRVAAILSKDKKMTQIFKEEKDIHTGVAMYVFNVPLEKVDGEMRRKAKVINFGIIYGMGVFSLRKNLGGTKEEAQAFYNNYFKQFSGVWDYLEEVKKFAEKNGYVQTLFGRKRNFPNINSKIPFIHSMALRTAINAPIQGTATADIIKLAIRFIDEDLKKENLKDKVHLVLQIHDELVYEIEEDILGKAEQIIKKAMEGVLERSYLKYKTEIPLRVNFVSGNNFGALK